MLGAEPTTQAVKTRAHRQIIRPKSQDAYPTRSPAIQALSLQQNKPKQQQEEVEIELEDSLPGATESEHQFACPWNKVKRLRSRENARSPNKDELHPRGWGVRSPKEIPCTCKISKNETKKSVRNSAILQSYKSQQLKSFKSTAHEEINRAVENVSKEIDKIKIFLTNEEVNELTNKIKKCFLKKVKSNKGKSAVAEKDGKKQLKKTSSLSAQVKIQNHLPVVPLQKERVVRPCSPARAPDDSNIMSNRGGITMTPTAVVGTMESTNYVIELSSQQNKQNHGEIKNLMSQVIPLSMPDKPKIVSVDGAYFAEIPNDFGQQVYPDSGVMRKRTENVTIYAMADHNPNVTYAKPKSPFSSKKYVPVTQVPGLHMINAHQLPVKQLGKK